MRMKRCEYVDVGSRMMMIVVRMVCLGIMLADNVQVTECKAGWEGMGLRMELLHKDHVSSPFRDGTNLSTIDRIHRDAVQSASRALALMVRAFPDQNFAAISTQDSRRLLANSYQAGVKGTGGDYSMSISLGTPLQNFLAIADTGSDLSWIQCDPCQTCYKQDDPKFNPSSSSTFKSLTCSSTYCQDIADTSNQLSCSSSSCLYTYAYGDNSSTTGEFVTDLVSLTTSDGKSMVSESLAFGCGTNNQGTFDSGTDGIVGLGRGTVSFTSQLGSVFGKKFSYCLVDRFQSETDSSLLLFGSAAGASVSGIQYTALLKDSASSVTSYYYVALSGISVQGQQLSIPSSSFTRDDSGHGGTIFDSGTTYTQLDSTAFDMLATAIQSYMNSYTQVTNKDLDLCYDITGLSSIEIPKVTFNFDKADLELQYDNLFQEADGPVGNQRITCLAMQSTDLGLNIIGNWQQMNFHVLYDLDKYEIGWVRTSCDSNFSSSGSGGGDGSDAGGANSVHGSSSLLLSAFIALLAFAFLHLKHRV